MTVKYDRWYLKEILDLKQLKKLFEYFSMITNLDVALFDFAGHEILAIRKENSVCHSAKNGSKCREHITSGSLRSSELGEPYICACGCGLISVSRRSCTRNGLLVPLPAARRCSGTRTKWR